MTTEQALQVALARHQAGQVAAAEIIYRQILAAQPNHADALHLLGAAALMSGRAAEAREWIERALQANPGNAIYESNLGEAYRRLGRIDEAIVHLRRAVGLQPNYADALNNLGSAWALKENWEEAVVCFQRCLALRPDDVGTLNNLGLALLKWNRPAEAIACYERVVTQLPNSADAHSQLAEALLQQEQWERAVQHGESALALDPSHIETHCRLGVAYLAVGRRAEAIACSERGLALKPESATLLTNVASVYLENGEYDKALSTCERALRAYPDFPPARWTHSIALLHAGRFEEGWREYEWRWQAPPLSRHRRSFSVPRWNGLPAPGQTILVYAEQGFGDAIQFLRYVPLLRERAAARRIVLECAQPLVRLFALALGDQVEIIPRNRSDDAHLPLFDQQIPMWSLPLALARYEPLPMAQPYLQADPMLQSEWRQRLGRGRSFRVGLAWMGNTAHLWSRRRAIEPEAFLPLLRLPGVTFHSLQVRSSGGVPQPMREAGLVDLTQHICDFADTAALVAEMDLVICIDTAVAHVAGALGRPVWTLLPFACDWRWGHHRDDTPWYPTMRLFRQPAEGDWDSVLHGVEEGCRALAGAQPKRG